MHSLNLRLLLVYAAVTWCAAAPAAWVNKNGEKLPETSFRKSNGDFIAQMVFVTDEQLLFKTWATPSESVDVKDIDLIAINQPINTFIVFGGCKADPKGNCKVTMRFRVVGPDGKLYAETPAMEVWHEKTLPPNRSLQLSVDYLKIIVEPHELSGKYVVNTEVRDSNSGNILKLQRTFTAAQGIVKK